jgi:hypothetical protein
MSAAPAPTVTVTSSSKPTYGTPDATTQSLMHEVWREESYADQARLCKLYRTSPDASFNAFNSGAKYPISRIDFDTFFQGVCA